MKPLLMLMLILSLPQAACIFSGGAPPGQTVDVSHDSGSSNNATPDMGVPSSNNASTNNASTNNQTTNNQSTNNQTTDTNNQTTTNNGTCVVPENSKLARICLSEEFPTCGALEIEGCDEPVSCGGGCVADAMCQELLCVPKGSVRRAPIAEGGGASVAFWGPFWAAGAPGSADSGEVAVFHEATRIQFPTPEPIMNMRFGASIAGLGPLLIVGAPGAITRATTSKGKTFLFEFSMTNTATLIGTQDASLIIEADMATNPVAEADFGVSVAIGGTDRQSMRTIVGAPGLDRALVTFQTEAPTSIVLPVAGQASVKDTAFGAAVAMSQDGKTVAVGAPLANEVHVFSESNTFATQKIVAPMPASAASFGAALALDPTGQRLIVGDPGAGEAHLFTHGANGWQFVDSFGPRTPTGYGESVAIHKQFLLVGQPRSGTGGALHIIGGGPAIGGYAPLAVIEAAELPGVYRGFGKSIAVNRERSQFVVGAPAPPGGPDSALWFSGL